MPCFKTLTLIPGRRRMENKMVIGMKEDLKGFMEGLVWWFIFEVNKDMLSRVS